MGWSVIAASATGGVELDRSEHSTDRGRVPLRPTLSGGYSVIVQPVGDGGEALAVAALLSDQVTNVGRKGDGPAEPMALGPLGTERGLRAFADDSSFPLGYSAHDVGYEPSGGAGGVYVDVEGDDGPPLPVGLLKQASEVREAAGEAVELGHDHGIDLPVSDGVEDLGEPWAVRWPLAARHAGLSDDIDQVPASAVNLGPYGGLLGIEAKP